jgi:ABC-type Fe3+-hydroxamate transport system substrate-binding protein
VINDLRGREFVFDRPPARIVSLVPSLTESLFDLGAGASLVGATDFCTYPANIRCARVGGTKNPDVQAIRALHPDLVHMNLEENLRRHAEEIETFAPVFVTEPKNVDDVESLLSVLGTIHHAKARAAELIASLREHRRALPPRQFTFACAIWKRPWMWCGGDTYVSALVESAGGENVLGHRHRYPEMDLDCLAAMEPQVVFLPDEPYTFTTADASEVAERMNARVIGPFPGHLFTWHGSRTILGLRFLREAL